MCETVCTRMPRELAEELLQSIHLLHIIEEHNGFELLPAEIDWAEVAEIEHEAEITILVDELDSVQKSLTETTVQLEQTIIDREHLREDVQRLININQKLVAEIDRLHAAYNTLPDVQRLISISLQYHRMPADIFLRQADGTFKKVE